MIAKLLAVALAMTVGAATVEAATKPAHPVVYGANPAAGRYFVHDGIRLYYEVYGKGPPLLLIHGNGASIWSMKRQIAYFSQHYRVIAMDSRDHGRSGDAPGALTFEAMADDLAALLDHLHVRQALVLGWSDGAIEALLLGMRHPQAVSKIAAMAGNLDPQGLAPDILKVITPPAKVAPGHVWTRAERVHALDEDEPHIAPDALATIQAPTLVLAADHDVIADEHTISIYHQIPKAQLAIFPDATHMIPFDDPARFNATVDRFFRADFVAKDRLADLLKTIKRMDAEQAADLAGRRKPRR